MRCDGVARPAVRAIDKRIAIAAIVLVRKFGKARSANRRISRNDGADRVAVAFENLEFGKAARFDLFGNYSFDTGKRRKLCRKTLHEARDGGLFAFHYSFNALTVV